MTTPRTSGRLVVLAAGGTGGHVFPAEALAQELLAQGHRLALVTDKRGTGYTGALGLIDQHHIGGHGITGKSIAGKLKGLIALGMGIFQARRLLEHLRPSVVVGFGGYASAPTVLAASQLGIPTVIHEQNAILGSANRLLARRVNRICTSIDLAKPISTTAQVIRTGLPVRPAVAAQRGAAYPSPTPDGTFRVLVLGGSQGARIFSDVIPAAVKLLPDALRKRLQISQQCRPEELDRTHAAYVGSDAHVQLRHFFDNVPELLVDTHLLISRSGASSVAEACVVGRPSLLIPLPSPDNHQTFNADALARVGGAWTIRQANFTPKTLAELLAQLAGAPGALAKAAAAAAAFSVPDAAERLAGVVVDLIRDASSAHAVHAPTSGTSPTTHIMKRGIV